MTTVRLIDGTEVASDSEEWRAECEARAVLTMPKEKRKQYLDGVYDPILNRYISKGVLQQRGQVATDKLKADIWKLWRHQKNQ